MGAFFRSIFLTALMIVGATMATAGLAVVVILIVAAIVAPPSDLGVLLPGGYIGFLAAALMGFFFSIVPLAIAAVTMPPAIGVMRLFKLPRPLFDRLGGAAMAWICALIAGEMFASLARSKGGDFNVEETTLILEICAVLGGGVLGYLRHGAMVEEREASDAAPLVAY
jgi:hypothetical protein